MEFEKVSIIVPIYKAELYLDRCVESIVNQTYSNLEIILVDDGSPDNCPVMCDEWAKKDNRITVIHKQNSGVSATRNAGLDAISGDYFMFADSDDYLDADMVEFLLKLAKDNDAQMSRCGFYVDYEDGRQENSFKQQNDVVCMDYNQQIADLVIAGHVSGVLWNKLYKTDTFADVRFDTHFDCNEDMLFNYDALSKNIKTAYKDDAKYHYFVHDGSVTKSEFGEGALSVIWAKQKIMEAEKDNEALKPYLIKGYIISCFVILSGIIRHQKCLDRYDYLRQEILKYKKDILSSSMYSKFYKVKTLILILCPTLYNKIISKQQGI